MRGCLRHPTMDENGFFSLDGGFDFVHMLLEIEITQASIRLHKRLQIKPRYVEMQPRPMFRLEIP